MKIVLFGDIHGRWNRVHDIFAHELGDVGTAISTGDLGNYKFNQAKGRTLYFSHGNHEHFGVVENMLDQDGQTDNGLVAMKPGSVYTLQDGTTIAALPGIFNEERYENPQGIKYYSKQDVENLLGIQDRVDIFVSHEAPRDVGMLKHGDDLGKDHINAIIEHLHPKIALFGHHHVYLESKINDTQVFGLDQPHRSYLTLNTNSFLIERNQAVLDGKKGYRYSW